jgi:hypothetical protein
VQHVHDQTSMLAPFGVLNPEGLPMAENGIRAVSG